MNLFLTLWQKLPYWPEAGISYSIFFKEIIINYVLTVTVLHNNSRKCEICIEEVSVIYSHKEAYSTRMDSDLHAKSFCTLQVYSW